MERDITTTTTATATATATTTTTNTQGRSNLVYRSHAQVVSTHSESGHLPVRIDTYFFCRVHKIPKSDYFLRHACLFVRPSARMEQLGSSGRIFMKFYISAFFGWATDDV
jgi:hypothetical protein